MEECIIGSQTILYTVGGKSGGAATGKQASKATPKDDKKPMKNEAKKDAKVTLRLCYGPILAARAMRLLKITL